jgi:hypothetical protein
MRTDRTMAPDSAHIITPMSTGHQPELAAASPTESSSLLAESDHVVSARAVVCIGPPGIELLSRYRSRSPLIVDDVWLRHWTIEI